MTESDKILLNAYLDGELSRDELNYIEDLLINDDKAKDFLNNLKRANIELNAFYTSNSIKRINSSLIEFINQNKSKKRKYFDGNFFQKVIREYNMLSYASVATIFLMLGLVYSPAEVSFDESFNEEIQFDLLDNEILKDLYIERGLNDYEKENDVKDLISEMITNKSSQGRLTFESSSLIIFLNEKKLSDLDYFCYSGEIYNSDGNESKFLYCESSKDSSLTIIN